MIHASQRKEKTNQSHGSLLQNLKFHCLEHEADREVRLEYTANNFNESRINFLLYFFIIQVSRNRVESAHPALLYRWFLVVLGVAVELHILDVGVAGILPVAAHGLKLVVVVIVLVLANRGLRLPSPGGVPAPAAQRRRRRGSRGWLEGQARASVERRRGRPKRRRRCWGRRAGG